MTVMYLYYNQPEAIPFFKALGYDELDIDFLFIDDGSKEPLKLDWAKVLRIDEDIAWNQPRANNLGLEYLYEKYEHETVLRMDIDHYFSVNDLQEIANYEPSKNEVVFFNRHNLKSHPNIFLANVKDLINIGGYNEDFCGNYGYDDKELVHRMQKNQFTLTTLNYHANVKQGLKTNLNRDTRINHNKYLNIVNEKSNS